MKNNKGFTLMEILLAAMIVGIIGLALAALTTAAVREGGVGRTKVMLRQQLSLALSQLRQDIAEAESIVLLADPMGNEDGDPLIEIGKSAIGPLQHEEENVEYVYRKGTIQGAGNPNSRTGGVICRRVGGEGHPCEVWLTNIKDISQNSFKSPSFSSIMAVVGASQVTGAGMGIQFRVILEVPTEPVVNEAVEEVFVSSQRGFPISKSED